MTIAVAEWKWNHVSCSSVGSLGTWKSHWRSRVLSEFQWGFRSDAHEGSSHWLWSFLFVLANPNVAERVLLLLHLIDVKCKFWSNFFWANTSLILRITVMESINEFISICWSSDFDGNLVREVSLGVASQEICFSILYCYPLLWYFVNRFLGIEALSRMFVDSCDLPLHLQHCIKFPWYFFSEKSSLEICVLHYKIGVNMLLGPHIHVLSDWEFSDTTIELVLERFLVAIRFRLFSCWLILLQFVFIRSLRRLRLKSSTSGILFVLGLCSFWRRIHKKTLLYQSENNIPIPTGVFLRDTAAFSKVELGFLGVDSCKFASSAFVSF